MGVVVITVRFMRLIINCVVLRWQPICAVNSCQPKVDRRLVLRSERFCMLSEIVDYVTVIDTSLIRGE